MTVLSVDFETRSRVDLRKAGVHVYAEDPSTDVWCAAWAFDDDDPALWWAGDPVPIEIAAHVLGGGTMAAWNAAFERVIWRHVLGPRYGFPVPATSQWRCTMAAAMALSLPGGLDDCAAALALDYRKDSDGYRKMLQMSRPRRVADDGTATWWDDPERRATLGRYCRQDVRVERAVGKMILPLREEEQRLWVLDQEINDRGVHVDVPLCEAAKDVAAQVKHRLDVRMAATTGNAVRACTNANQLREWLNQRGVACDSVGKDEVNKMLAREDLPGDVRAALELRQQGSQTSVAKADALLAGRGADGRARGMMQFHAASTGRWGGRRFQPQNLKRPDESTDIPEAISLVLTRNLPALEMFYDDPMSVIGDCIRGMVVAAPGRMLRAADFSNIEGRNLAWLAGEQWKLDAFAAFDRGDGPDLYKVAAGAILEKPAAEVTKPERQNIGKVAELALGYQGGVGAMMTMSKGRVPFAEMHDSLAASMPEHADAARDAYEQRGRGAGLSRAGWVAAEIIKLAWRATNPAIVQFWRDMEAAAIDAVARPGAVTRAGRICFRVAGSFLFMQLPSKRCLAYPFPKLRGDVTPWGKSIQKLCFMGVDSRTHKWGPRETYGGALVENATQAVARDCLAFSLLTADAEGWDVVLHVHDEIVTETDPGFGSTAALEALMAQKPDWLHGCPISTAGWSEARYQK